MVVVATEMASPTRSKTWLIPCLITNSCLPQLLMVKATTACGFETLLEGKENPHKILLLRMLPFKSSMLFGLQKDHSMVFLDFLKVLLLFQFTYPESLLALFR